MTGSLDRDETIILGEGIVNACCACRASSCASVLAGEITGQYETNAGRAAEG
jgi:hypothetical protein